MRISLLRRGVSPGVGPVGALVGLRWLHLYRLTLDLIGLLLLPGALGAPVGVFCLPCGIPPVFMAIIWSVSLTLRVRCASPPDGVVPWTLAWRVTGWPYCPPPRSSRTLSFALASGHDSTVLIPPAKDSGESPSLYGGFDPLLLRCAWWSSRPG